MLSFKTNKFFPIFLFKQSKNWKRFEVGGQKGKGHGETNLFLAQKCNICLKPSMSKSWNAVSTKRVSAFKMLLTRCQAPAQTNLTSSLAPKGQCSSPLQLPQVPGAAAPSGH